MPQDVAFASIDVSENPRDAAGADHRYNLVGREAVKQVLTLLNLNLTGIPENPKTVLVDSHQREGFTLPDKSLAPARHKRRPKSVSTRSVPSNVPRIPRLIPRGMGCKGAPPCGWPRGWATRCRRFPPSTTTEGHTPAGGHGVWRPAVAVFTHRPRPKVTPLEGAAPSAPRGQCTHCCVRPFCIRDAPPASIPRLR
ncbi:MAG: hypothetical protein U1F61_03400 [Opitutaceae bacterium]